MFVVMLVVAIGLGGAVFNAGHWDTTRSVPIVKPTPTPKPTL